VIEGQFSAGGDTDLDADVGSANSDDPLSLSEQLVERLGSSTNHDTNSPAQFIDQVSHRLRKGSLPGHGQRRRVVLQGNTDEAAASAFLGKQPNTVSGFDQRLLGSLPWCEYRLNLGCTGNASRSVRGGRQSGYWSLVGHVGRSMQ
jgi:hypothetical protein